MTQKNCIGSIVADMFRHQAQNPTYGLPEFLYNYCFSPGASGNCRQELLERLFGGSQCSASEVIYNTRLTPGNDIHERVFAVIPRSRTVITGVLVGGKAPQRMLRAYAESLAEACGDLMGDDAQAEVTVRLAVFAAADVAGIADGSGQLCRYAVRQYRCRPEGGWVQRLTAHLLTEGEKITRSVDLMQRTRCELNSEKSRVLQRMESLGIRSMEGRNCSYRLQKDKISRRCNIDLLAKDFPQAYQACVTEIKRSPFLIVNRKSKSAEPCQ